MPAISIDNLANSQLTYDLIKYINENKKNWPIYYKNITPSVMNVDGFICNFSNLSQYHGKVLCFDIPTLQIVSNICHGKVEFYLYLYDLEWLYKPMNYFEVVNILNLAKIACRSKIHQENIRNYVNKTAIVCQNMKEVDEWITQN